MTNKELQVIYNYLINDVSDEEIRELIIYLREYISNGSCMQYNLTENDFDHFKRLVTLFN